MSSLRDNITFILVRSRFASNLGSAVRAIRNMGFCKLVLVHPRCEVGMEARSYAMRGAEILDRAEFQPSLEAAAERIGLLVGTTGALRGSGRRTSPCRGFCESLLPRLASSPTGIVFGPEDNGLNQEEASLCQWLLEIPTGSSYSSLNLAQAVAIVAYEMHLGLRPQQASALDLARPADVDALLDSFQRLAHEIEIGATAPAAKLLQRLRRIVGRAELEKADTRMLMGVLSQIRKRTGPGQAG